MLPIMLWLQAVHPTVTFSLPGFLIGPLLHLIIPLVAGGIASWLHSEVARGEGWYSQQGSTVQLALGVVLAVVLAGVGSALAASVAGGAAVASACATGTALSSDCLSGILALISPANITALLTAILTAAGITGSKLAAIHQAQKEIAAAQHVTLSHAAQ